MRRLQVVLGLAGIVAILILVGTSWRGMPATIPIHFAANGRANGYGSRIWLWFPPAMAALVYVVLTVVQRAPIHYNLPVRLDDPRRAAYEVLAAEMIGWLRVTLVWIFFVISVVEAEGAQGHAGRSVLWLLPVVLSGGLLPILSFVWRARSLRR